MRHTRQTIKHNVVFTCQALKDGARLFTQIMVIAKPLAKVLNRATTMANQLFSILIPFRPLLNTIQALNHGINQGFTAILILQQVILDIRITSHHPHIA